MEKKAVSRVYKFEHLKEKTNINFGQPLFLVKRHNSQNKDRKHGHLGSNCKGINELTGDLIQRKKSCKKKIIRSKSVGDKRKKNQRSH